MLTICTTWGRFKTEQSHLKRPLKRRNLLKLPTFQVSDSDKNYSILKTQLKIKITV